MQEVTLAQVLDAREARAARQQRLLEQFGCTLISFTMNIPGPVKISPAICRAFAFGIDLLEHRLPAAAILHREQQQEITGCQAFYVVDREASEVKRICTAIEDGLPLGRLFDLDVLTSDGTKLDRSLVGGGDRGCIVCGAPGRGCASRRIHPAPELQQAANRIIREHFAREDAERTAALAVQSLLDEVATTPKPGLVDRDNTGSHRDMDIFTFHASAASLWPYFHRCAEIGQQTAQLSPEETFALLRQAGLLAEQRMYAATGGINTHKGAIYTLGILCGAWGRLWTAEQPFPKADALSEVCASLARASAAGDLTAVTDATADTAGTRLYLRHGLTGIRGEAAAGLPSVARFSLPILRQGLEAGLPRNHAGAAALIHLIAHVADTNLYHRGGPEGAAYAADAAKALLKKGDFPSLTAIARLDRAFTEKNLSPGGCADLLAVTYFLHSLESLAE